MSGLPDLLAHVEAVAGIKAALELARQRGGRRIYVSARKGSALVKILGAAAAAKLVERIGPGEVVVPMAHLRGQKGRRVAAAEMMANGAKVHDVVAACDIHERTAWRVKRRIGEAGDDAQPDLFAGPRED